MSKVFKIHSNTESYMTLTLDDLDILTRMPDFQIQAVGLPLPIAWIAPKAEFIPADNSSEIRPSITQWSTNDLVISTSAREKLSAILTHELIETYPLSGNASDYCFLNPIQRIGNQVVDNDRLKISYFEDGSVNEIEKLVLHASTSASLPALFTLDIDDGVDLYCNERLKAAIEQGDLQGLTFEEVAQS